MQLINRRSICCALSALILFALPIHTHAQDQKAIDKAMATCGPANSNYHVQLQAHPEPLTPPNGKARVFFIGNSIFPRLISNATVVRIGIDGSWAGAVKYDSWFELLLPPGTHHFCAEWKNASSMNGIALNVLDLQPGQNYYLVASNYALGTLPTVLTFDELNPDEASLLIHEWPRAIATPSQK